MGASVIGFKILKQKREKNSTNERSFLPVVDRWKILETTSSKQSTKAKCIIKFFIGIQMKPRKLNKMY